MNKKHIITTSLVASLCLLIATSSFAQFAQFAQFGKPDLYGKILNSTPQKNLVMITYQSEICT